MGGKRPNRRGGGEGRWTGSFGLDDADYYMRMDKHLGPTGTAGNNIQYRVIKHDGKNKKIYCRYTIAYIRIVYIRLYTHI